MSKTTLWLAILLVKSHIRSPTALPWILVEPAAFHPMGNAVTEPIEDSDWSRIFHAPMSGGVGFAE